MRALIFLAAIVLRLVVCHPTDQAQQAPLLRHANDNRQVSAALFSDLEELARIVDISYCVGLAGIGISKPFKCLSRCSDFPDFELVTTWNTGQLMSDSCGYVALSHGAHPRVIVAFRGTYSISNTIVDLATVPQEYAPFPGDVDGSDAPKCANCTVHTGFATSWNVTSSTIVPHVEVVMAAHPDYQLTLVGHSLGGAVAALAGLDFVARGWDPVVTTFGEPRIGNAALMRYIDDRFNLIKNTTISNAAQQILHGQNDSSLRYRRVTHVDDPVPLLPLSEWGYRMHAGEIYISKASLSPDIMDLHHCTGDEDSECIAGQDASLSASADLALTKRTANPNDSEDESEVSLTLSEAVEEAEQADRAGYGWAVPARYKLWQLFFAHRDYFWRLGLCVPGGDPWDWSREKYDVELD